MAFPPMASMGPLFFRAENALRRIVQEDSRASMGPLFFRAENAAGPVLRAGFGVPSMGPLFFRAENKFHRQDSPVPAWPLQWGRSFSERRTSQPVADPIFLQSFNGAALFQSGEPNLGVSVSLEFLRPSMGPLFFRAENGPAVGRVFCQHVASMGALFFRAENDGRIVVLQHSTRASMGPLLFRAENIAGKLSPGDGVGASMGPLFFRAENTPAAVRLLTVEGLQWGRSFSERRTMLR